MSFASVDVTEHLDELRGRILWALVPGFVLVCVLYPVSGAVVLALCDWVLPGHRLVAFSLTEAFLVRLKVSFLMAFVFTAPWTGFQLAAFVAPGLHREERFTLFSMSALLASAFGAGAAFALFVGLRPLFALFSYQALGGSQANVSSDTLVSISCLFLLAGGAFAAIPALLFCIWRFPIPLVPILGRSRRQIYATSAALLLFLAPAGHFWAVVVLALPWVACVELCIRVLSRWHRSEEGPRS